MAIITTEDIGDLLLRTLDAREANLAAALIADVVADVESYVGRTLEIDDFHYEGSYLPELLNVGYIELPKTPIVSITTVTVDGEDWGQQFKRERSGVTLHNVLTSTNDEVLVEIDYTAGVGDKGVDKLRPMIKRRVIRLFNKALEDALGSSSAQVEGMTVSFETEGFTLDEIKIMDKSGIRKPTVWRAEAAQRWPSGLTGAF